MKLIPVSAAVPPLAMVKDSVLVPDTPIVLGVKLLVMDGGLAAIAPAGNTSEQAIRNPSSKPRDLTSEPLSLGTNPARFLTSFGRSI